MTPNDYVTTISIVNTGILRPRQSNEATTIGADAGTYDYYCALLTSIYERATDDRILKG